MDGYKKVYVSCCHNTSNESCHVVSHLKPGPQLVVAVVGVVGRSCGNCTTYLGTMESGVVGSCRLL